MRNVDTNLMVIIMQVIMFANVADVYRNNSSLGSACARNL
jgi:hypothetical protein